jgi:hypothetical protein
LVGFAAIAVDVGALYAERGQLQNGADAAALAIAQDCAVGACGDTAATAGGFANANANDGAANIVNIDLGSNSVTVSDSTLTASGDTNVPHPFAALIGVTSTTVHAEATAVWGAPKAATVLPLAISYCEFEKAAAAPGTPMLVRYDKNQPCPDLQIPGGFGWLDSTDGPCAAAIDLDAAQAGSAPGNAYPPGCAETFTGMAGKTVLVPIFDHAYDKNGVEILAGGKAVGGQNGTFHIYAFAAFTIMNWRFSGGNKLPEVYMTGSPLACGGECRGLVGTFDHWVSVDAAGTELGGPDLGASVVRLVLKETP